MPNGTKIRVYTSITGGKDEPRSDIKVFSDYDRFKSARLNAKIYKVLPHLFLDEDIDYSIFVDGNLFLKTDPEILVKKAESDVAVFEHHARDNIYEEAETCIEKNLDDPEVIKKQVKRYKSEGFSENKLGACFLIIRKHTPEVSRLNEKWWAEICRGSSRDQISFPYVFRDVDYMELDDVRDNKYFKREYHRKGSNFSETIKSQLRKKIPESVKNILSSN